VRESWILSVDLGKSADFTAAALFRVRNNAPEPSTYACPAIERWPLRTSYMRIVDALCPWLLDQRIYGQCDLAFDVTGVGTAVREMFDEERLENDWLLLKAIGAGELYARLKTPQGKAEMLAEARKRLATRDDDATWSLIARILAYSSVTRTFPVMLHGGAEVSVEHSTNTYHVPKRDVVADTSQVLSSDRLEVAGRIPLRSIAMAELKNFKSRPTKAGNEAYEAREGEHDDIVLAMAIGLWVGEEGDKWDPSR
jgi:hypothetical protein